MKLLYHNCTTSFEQLKQKWRQNVLPPLLLLLLFWPLVKGKRKRGRVLPRWTWKKSPRLGYLVLDPKESRFPMLPLFPNQRRTLAFTVMTRGIGNEATWNTCRILRMESWSQHRQVFTLFYQITHHILIPGSSIQDMVFIFVLIFRG